MGRVAPIAVPPESVVLGHAFLACPFRKHTESAALRRVCRKKADLPQKIRRHPRKVVLESEGWRGQVIVKIENRVARKLRRIILLQSSLVTFRLHFGKTRTVRMFMIFGPSVHGHFPKTNFLDFGYTKLFIRIQGPTYLRQCHFWKPTCLKSLGKTCAEHS